MNRCNRKCNHLTVKYGYEKLHFYQGDIADYEGVSSVDMVVTLHACDTATFLCSCEGCGMGSESYFVCTLLST